MSLKEDATTRTRPRRRRAVVDVRRREDPLAPAVWFLVAEAGHVGCGGWAFDRRDKRLRCVCGAALYEFRKMDRKAAANDPG